MEEGARVKISSSDFRHSYVTEEFLEMAKEKNATGDVTKKRTRKTPVASAERLQAVPENGGVQTRQAPGNGSSERGTRSEDQVRRRAYELWEQRGRQHGRDADDWFRAESEVRGKSA
jgi:hypothetical protein